MLDADHPASQPIEWPPNYSHELRRRMRRALMLREDRDMQIAMMKHYSSGVEGCIDWINDWCVTFDPRLEGMKKIPFLLFPKQKDFVYLIHECIRTRESMLVEKCRDVGASWICVAISVWLWLFIDGATIGWGSRKEEYVDQKGNPKAIFPKIRQLISSLPYWMMPFGFNMRDYAPYMKIINPMNDATITGEAGDNIGRGGRSTIFFKDESAHYERSELIEAALSENTDVQVDISSVNGSTNVFYKRRMAGEIWQNGKVMATGVTRVFIFDWRDHPGKTQEWYDRKRSKAEREGMLHVFAQEVDRDYSGSTEGIIINQEWVRSSIDAHIKLESWGNWFSGEKIAGQDIADGGRDANGYASRHGVVLRRVEAWGGEAGEAARHSIPLCMEDSVNEIYYDSIGVGAGFKVETNRMMQEPQWPKSLRVFKWNAAASPLDATDHVIPGDNSSPTNEDQYLNLKAQAWFRLRTRFYKTHKAITSGDKYPVEELISIPSNMENIHQVCMEFSQAIKKTSLNGKTMVDKKPEGSASPNMADAVVMAYSPTREVSILDVL